MTQSHSKEILFASALGFMAGILFAPKSGQETRRDLMAKKDEIKDSLKHKAEETADIVQEKAEQAKDTVDRLKQRGEKGLEQTKTRLRRAEQDMQS